MSHRAFVACAMALVISGGRALADRTAAEREVEAGFRDEQAGRYAEASARYSKAIEEDPSWWSGYASRAWISRGLKSQITGLDDIATAIRLAGSASPSHYEGIRLLLLADLSRWDRIALDAPAAVKKWPGDPLLLQVQGLARIHVGEIEAGLADLEAGRRAREGADSFSGIPEAYLLMAEPDSALRVLGEMRKEIGELDQNFQLDWTRGKVDSADLAGATSDYNKLPPSRNVRIILAHAYITGTPGHPYYDPAASLLSARSVQADFGSTQAFWIEARTLYFAGRYSDAISAIERGGREEDFWCLFWKGMATLKREDYSKARVILIEARRRNPYFLKHAAKLPEAVEFATRVDREVAREAERGSGSGESRIALALRRLTIPEIEGAAMAVRFRRALSEYRKLTVDEFSKSTADRIKRRISELSGAADAMDKLISSINKGSRGIELTVGSNKLKVTAADDEGFQFAIAKGSGRFPWSSLDPWELYCLANEERLTGPERCGLAAFLWDAGEIRRSAGELDRAAVLSPEMRAAFDESISLRKGLPVPDGGFVYFKGDWVTPDEKANLQKGLVRFEGAWVSAADREKLKKGLVKSGDKWIARADKELLDRGWRKEKGAWLSPEDYVAIHQDWKNAWETTTEHFQIRTNLSESLMNSLAGMLEAALPEMRGYHLGGEVRPAAGKKIQVFAFRAFSDYRAYCEKSGSLDRLNAAGFARSDSDTIVGWNKTDNEADLCSTIAHELEHYVSFRLHPGVREPSWFAEGTATYFEGVRYLDGRWRFHDLVEARLQYLQAELSSGKPLDLESLMEQNAGDLVRSNPGEALTFYSTCWALVYYLENCGDSRTRKAFEDFKKSLWAGGPSDLKAKIPDLKSLEAAVTRFVLGL